MEIPQFWGKKASVLDAGPMLHSQAELGNPSARGCGHMGGLWIVSAFWGLQHHFEVFFQLLLEREASPRLGIPGSPLQDGPAASYAQHLSCTVAAG